MTNKEIIQASLLDILFENRNKAYGAYALRKTYNHRMQWSLGICLGIALLLVMLNFIKGGHKIINEPTTDSVFLTTIEIPKDKPKDIERPRPQKTVQPQVAQIQNTPIKIVDNNVKVNVPTNEDLQKALTSTKTTDGLPPDGTPQKIIEPVTGTDNGNTNKPEPEKPVLPSFSAKFPGGNDALAEFLKRYLVTPDELEADQKKTVLVRFMVDEDGSISKAEIVQSGGNSFDKEVLRVIRKMPKWIPAQQNGLKVSSYFTQSVTFIAVEQ